MAQVFPAKYEIVDATGAVLVPEFLAYFLDGVLLEYPSGATVSIPAGGVLRKVCCEPKPYCDIAYTYEWREGATSCQELVVTSLSQVTAPYTVTANGVDISNTLVIGQPRNGNVDLEITDANGCTIREILTNDIAVDFLLYSGAGQDPSANTINGVGEYHQEMTNIDGAISTHNTVIIQNDSGNWDALDWSNEVIYLRYGTTANPQIAEFNLNNSRDPIPIQNPACGPFNIEWSIEWREVQGMQASDTATTFLEFYQGATLLERRQVSQLSGNFTTAIETGVELVPAGADGVKLVGESDTGGSARQHRVYRRPNTFMRQT